MHKPASCLPLTRVWHKLLLTGTPLQNNIGELFMLLHFLDASKFPSLEEFEQNFSDLGHEQQVCEGGGGGGVSVTGSVCSGGSASVVCEGYFPFKPF